MPICFNVKYFLLELKAFSEVSIFFLLVHNLENGWKNIFQCLVHMKNFQIFLIFSYNLRSYEEQRDDKEAAEEKKCVRIKGYER